MQVSLIKEYTKTRCLSFVTSIVYPFSQVYQHVQTYFFEQFIWAHCCKYTAVALTELDRKREITNLKNLIPVINTAAEIAFRWLINFIF